MPVEEFTCKICGKSVTKRKSLYVPNLEGRVCKEHQDEIEKNQKIEKEEILKTIFDAYRKIFDDEENFHHLTSDTTYAKICISNIIGKHIPDDIKRRAKEFGIEWGIDSEPYKFFKKSTELAGSKIMLFDKRYEKLLRGFWEREQKMFFGEATSVDQIKNIFIFDENDLTKKIHRDLFIKSGMNCAIRMAWMKFGEIANELCNGEQLVTRFIESHPNQFVREFFLNLHPEIFKELIESVTEKGPLNQKEIAESIGSFVGLMRRVKENE